MPIKQMYDFTGKYEVKEQKNGPKVLFPSREGLQKVSADRLSLMFAARDLLEKEHPVTLRRLYYMLYGAGWIDNSQKTYSGIVIPVMVDARQWGIIPWDWLVDETRPPRAVQTWEGPEDFLKQVPGWYSRDIWKDQDVYIEVCIEKRADLAYVVQAAHPYYISVSAGNGYDGWSSVYQLAKRFAKFEAKGKQCHLLYLGDYDPSGLHMTVSLEERLNYFGVTPEVQRLAVNRKDVDEFSLPEWEGKESDSRADWMLEHYGELLQVEMDAMPIPAMQEKIREAVENILNMEAFEAIRTREEKEAEALKRQLKKVRIAVDDDEEVEAPPKRRETKPTDAWKPGDSNPWESE